MVKNILSVLFYFMGVMFAVTSCAVAAEGNEDELWVGLVLAIGCLILGRTFRIMRQRENRRADMVHSLGVARQEDRMERIQLERERKVSGILEEYQDEENPRLRGPK